MRLAPVYQQVRRRPRTWTAPGSTTRPPTRSSPGASSINGQTYAFDFVRATYTPAALRTAGTDPADGRVRRAS